MTDLFAPTIHTERLLLRPLTDQDALALLTIFSDPEVMRYWNTPPWSCMADALDFIRQSAQAAAKQQSLALAIALQSNGALIGMCLLFSYDAPSRRAELGFGIGRSYWGKGYVAEAGQALISYGFDALKLRRIEAEIDPDNTASGATLERLGFVKEGHLRQRWEINGVLSDSALYGLLHSDRTA